MVTMEIVELIHHPERLDRDTLYELRSLLALYPYWQTARLLMLQNLYLLHDPTFDEELRRAAIYITDRRVLFQMIEAAHYQLRQQLTPNTQHLTPNAPTSRTIDLIDTFLEQEKGRIVLDLPEEEPSDSDHDHEEEGEEEYFTETLARIYIKQGRYQRALDIITRLSEHYPKKNAYFADQIRFLEKLIINSKNNSKVKN